MRYRRLPIEIESPEQFGYGKIRCNLTESSFADAPLGELAKGLESLLLCYGDHAGLPRLRALVAEDNKPLTADDVLVTPGAAAALFIAATALLEKGDRVLVERPNYATNIETPRALGCAVDFLDLDVENGFRVTADMVRAKLTPKTKLVSITVPHNPSGSMLEEAELKAIVEAVERNGSRLLVDETYREMAYGRPLPLGATLSQSAISVCSLSKSFGLPGIRMGWLACRDRALMETFLAAKEQIVICNSILDEEIAARALEARFARLAPIKEKIREHFHIVRGWMASEPRLEWVEPAGGVVCFPRIKAGAAVDADKFYAALNSDGVFVGPGHWFEQDRRHFRLGFGWPKTQELRDGLQAISLALTKTAGTAAVAC
jgi:aspartate/methionine/tyrosine aminotransferase